MSLITIDRSLFAPSSDCTGTVSLHDGLESSSKSSQSEDFLMCKATAVGLNVRSRRRSSHIKPNDDIQDHLKKILGLLRFGDYVQLAVRLQTDYPRPHRHRYCCVISTSGKQGTEESAILGIDITDRKATIGLVLPIWQDMSVKLYGDGGFELVTKDTEKQFKPVSVQALWAAFQAVNRACHVARTNAYFSRGLTHDWISFYHNLPASDTYQIQEWLKTDDIDSFNRYVPPQAPLSSDATDEEKERRRMEALLRTKLQQIMYSVDLEEVTVLQLRQRLEDELQQPLRDYRHFIEEEVLIIYGRMDEASVILDHLLLGTTFNASNRAELEKRSVSHILNVTREVDNFFPGDKFEYKNIRVYDDEQSSLLSHFEETHRFINEAKTQGTACLVHCKMGISRSATVVIAYLMKENNWDLDTAFAFVKCRRSCIQPNLTFMRELRTYQGILEASSNRHKPIFCKDNAELSRPVYHLSNPIPESPLIDPLRATSCRPSSNNAPLCGSSEPVPRSSAPTPTPLLLSDSSETDPHSSVDLEAELFAYKPSPQPNELNDLLALLAVDPCHPSMEAAASDTGSPEISDIGPYRVWDLGEKDIKELARTDRPTTLLAHNSHCLRQWHPDLLENVKQGDVGPITKIAVKSSTVRFGELNMLVSLTDDVLEEIQPVAVVEPKYSDSTMEFTEHRIGSAECLIRTHQPLHEVALPVVSTPVLLHATVEHKDKQGDAVASLPLGAMQKENLIMDSIRPSFVFRMACKLAESNALQSSVVCSTTPPLKRSSTVIVPRYSHTSPHSPRRHFPPSIPYGSPVKGLSPQDGPISNRLTQSVIETSAKERSVAVHSTPGLSDDPAGSSVLDKLTYWTRRREDSHIQDPSSTGILFRSTRNSPSSQKTNTINRTQSVRVNTNHPFVSRLRPDNSWIVCSSTSANSSRAESVTDKQQLRLSNPFTLHKSPSADQISQETKLPKPQALRSPRISQLKTRLLQPTIPGRPTSIPPTTNISTTDPCAPSSRSSFPLFSVGSKDRSSEFVTDRTQPNCDTSNSSSCMVFRPVRRLVTWPPAPVNPVSAES